MAEIAIVGKKERMVMDDMDKVYDMVEGKGRYKYIVLLATTLSYMCYMYYLCAVPYFLILPKAECNLGGNWRECTHDEICSNCVLTSASCSYRLLEPREFNFITEFGWYCEEGKSTLYTATAFFVGTTASTLIVTTFSDIIGRLPMIIVGASGNILMIAMLMYFANENMCLVASLSIGFFAMANNSNSFNFLVDSIPARYRNIYPSVLNVAWGVGEIGLSFALWTGISWRAACLLILGATATMFVPLIWLRESPKFYFSQNDLPTAYAKLKRIIRINSVYLDKKIELRFPQRETEKITMGQKLRAMCCDRATLVQIVLVTALFSIGNMTFYAVTLNLEHMGGNVYLNGILLAVSEIAACTMSGYSLEFMSPQVAISISYLLTTAGLAGLAVFWEDSTLSIVFGTLGKLGSTSVDNLMYTISGTIFPTPILGSSIGVAFFVTRFGDMAAKPMHLLGTTNMCIILGAMSALATLLPFLLKEQTGKVRDEKSPKETDTLAESPAIN